MIDTDIEKKYNEMVEMFGDKLLDFDHYPIQFSYYVKLFNYVKGLVENESSNQ